MSALLELCVDRELTCFPQRFSDIVLATSKSKPEARVTRLLAGDSHWPDDVFADTVLWSPVPNADFQTALIKTGDLDLVEQRLAHAADVPD